MGILRTAFAVCSALVIAGCGKPPPQQPLSLPDKVEKPYTPPKSDEQHVHELGASHADQAVAGVVPLAEPPQEIGQCILQLRLATTAQLVMTLTAAQNELVKLGVSGYARQEPLRRWKPEDLKGIAGKIGQLEPRCKQLLPAASFPLAYDPNAPEAQEMLHWGFRALSRMGLNLQNMEEQGKLQPASREVCQIFDQTAGAWRMAMLAVPYENRGRDFNAGFTDFMTGVYGMQGGGGLCGHSLPQPL